MAKLYFRYGAMGSSKSANILMVRYNYEEPGQYAVLLKPRTDNRDGEHRLVPASVCLLVWKTRTVQHPLCQRKNRARRCPDHAQFQRKLCGTLPETLQGRKTLVFWAF